MPFASDEVVQVATPLPLRVGVLRIAAPSEKVTVPVERRRPGAGDRRGKGDALADGGWIRARSQADAVPSSTVSTSAGDDVLAVWAGSLALL